MRNACVGSGLVAVAVMLCAGCASESKSNMAAPSNSGSGSGSGSASGSSGSGSSASTPSNLGSWVSTSIPDAKSCGDFQWTVTSDTGTAIAGDFSLTCGKITASGHASGQLNGPVEISGSGSLPGLPPCNFSLTGTASAGDDALRITYSGTTCLGPVSGAETLRRHTYAEPPPPPPPPPAPAPQGENPHHVPPGPLSAERASQVVFAAGDEFPSLKQAFGSDQEAVDAADQLLRRTIWHLQHTGFQSARQRNPSGVISSDKLNVLLSDGVWHVYDIFRLGYAGVATQVQFYEITGSNPVPDGGISD